MIYPNLEMAVKLYNMPLAITFDYRFLIIKKNLYNKISFK